MELEISPLTAPPVSERPVEIVERKGLGHPDTICDAVSEAASLALSRAYLERCGRVLHHNVDKVLLRGGIARPAFGGGEVLEPIEIYLAGRATGAGFDLHALLRATALRWLREHLRALDPKRHTRIECLVRPGSVDLVDLFEGGDGRPLANDTSMGCGYAPLSELEVLVLSVEELLTAPATRARRPALGEDVKVMGVRRGEAIDLTVACALIGRELCDLGVDRAGALRPRRLRGREAGDRSPRPRASCRPAARLGGGLRQRGRRRGGGARLPDGHRPLRRSR
jgi:S-adenosylmethionine synthetase